MYFDGSDVGLSSSAEDVDAVFVDQGSNNPDIFISTRGNFAVAGNAGANEDVFAFRPNQLGSTTAGSFMPSMVFDGSYYGLTSLDVDGFYFGPAPGSATPWSMASESASHVEQGGNDAARLYGLAGADYFDAGKDRVELRGAGFRHQTYSFANATAYDQGGFDRVHLFDSAGNDQFREGEGASDFDEAIADRVNGEYDRFDVAAVDFLFEELGNWLDQCR